MMEPHPGKRSEVRIDGLRCIRRYGSNRKAQQSMPKAKTPPRKIKRPSATQIVFVALTVVILLSFVLSLFLPK